MLPVNIESQNTRSRRFGRQITDQNIRSQGQSLLFLLLRAGQIRADKCDTVFD